MITLGRTRGAQISLLSSYRRAAYRSRSFIQLTYPLSKTFHSTSLPSRTSKLKEQTSLCSQATQPQEKLFSSTSTNMAPCKIIIDTDPVCIIPFAPTTTRPLTSEQGVDDILAMLLAFSALPEELQVLLISVTYGNIDVQNCLRNVISLFHHIEQEIAWRESVGRHPGFETLRKSKPVVAVGPEHPLADNMLMADFFRKSRHCMS